MLQGCAPGNTYSFLSCLNTHRPAHRYLNAVSRNQRKQTYTTPLLQTQGVCVHQFLDSELTHRYTCQCSKLHNSKPIHTHRYSYKGHTPKCIFTPVQICSPVTAREMRRKPFCLWTERHNNVHSQIQAGMFTELSHRASLRCTRSPCPIRVIRATHSGYRHDRLDLITRSFEKKQAATAGVVNHQGRGAQV